MPPIPVFANAPLHPDGVTPKTAPPEEQQPAPSRTVPATTTAQYDPSSPPAPQPGARPQPPAPTSTSSNPAAPQPGGIPSVTEIHTTTTTSHQAPPPQFSIPAPTSNFAPTHSTQPITHQPPAIPQPSPFETGISGFGVGEDVRRPSLEHPPGYVQNPYAADGSASDRAKFEDTARRASEEEGVLGTVKSYLGGVGVGLKKAEEEAWKLAKGLGGGK